jgi:hypothetical protein
MPVADFAPALYKGRNPAWHADTQVFLGDVIEPKRNNDAGFELFQAVAAGTTGKEEPFWTSTREPYRSSSAREFGISLSKPRARLLTAEMMSQADVVSTMDFQNQAELKARYPFFEEKVRSLAIFADRGTPGVKFLIRTMVILQLPGIVAQSWLTVFEIWRNWS